MFHLRNKEKPVASMAFSLKWHKTCFPAGQNTDFGWNCPPISALLCGIWEEKLKQTSKLHPCFSTHISSICVEFVRNNSSIVPHPTLYKPILLFFRSHVYVYSAYFPPIFCSFSASLALFVPLILHWSCLAGSFISFSIKESSCRTLHILLFFFFRTLPKRARLYKMEP